MRLSTVFIFILISGVWGSCEKKHNENSTKEAWDSRNSPVVFGNIPSMSYGQITNPEYMRGFLENKPWSDSYWPLYLAGIANRWLDDSYPVEFDMEASDYTSSAKATIAAYLQDVVGADDRRKAKLSPAEKYDLAFGKHPSDPNTEKRFPITSQELFSYAENSKYYDENNIPWSWMGLCHGWALASYVLEPPMTAVLYNNGTSKTLFTAGDVRAIVTKGFAENDKDGEEYFMGTRCELSQIAAIRDGKNRIIDGVIGVWKSEQDRFENQKSINVLYNNWTLAGQGDLASEANVIVFNYIDSVTELANKKFWLLATDWVDQSKGIVRVEVRPYELDSQGRLTLDTPATEFDFKYQKSCRDLNPGALHLSLAGLLSNGATVANNGLRQSFTIEIARFDQVWNQPVYGYISKIGELTPLDATYASGVKDPLSEFRASGVKYLAHVFTTIYYGVENGPRMIYRDQDELTASKTYQYTLEFDENQKIVGGEWHSPAHDSAENLTPLHGEALLLHLQSDANESVINANSAPDFLWRYLRDVKITDRCASAQCIKSEFMYKLHACSRRAASGQTIDVDGSMIPYVDCE